MGEISVIELFFQATLVVKLVILILIIASVLTWLIIFERNLYFKNFKKNSDSFEKKFIATNDLEIIFSQLKALDQNSLFGKSNVFFTAFAEYKLCKENGLKNHEAYSNIERSIRIALSKDADEHNKHLFFLANVGSVSPYIGLFGTVIGIVNAFFGLSDASQATINAVAPGISEALIATALGLFAAIPAVIAFNRFTAFSNDLIRFDSIFGEQLISRFTHLDTK